MALVGGISSQLGAFSTEQCIPGNFHSVFRIVSRQNLNIDMKKLLYTLYFVLCTLYHGLCTLYSTLCTLYLRK